MEIEVLKLTLTIDRDLSLNDAEKVRGYLGNIFWSDPIVHHHHQNGSFLYQYPRLQYKIVEGSCVLIGFKEGIEVLKKVFSDLQAVNINGDWQRIFARSIESYSSPFGESSEPVTYTFLTPWLALNEENYEKFQCLGSWKRRRELIKKILIGNILSLAKSLNYTVTQPLNAEIGAMRKTRVLLKRTPFFGFLGKFSVNFEIPDYLGLGKSVARGFGTIKKCNL
ncbi:MAG: CRISPR-associated endonuclease Cas6 [bacterium]